MASAHSKKMFVIYGVFDSEIIWVAAAQIMVNFASLLKW